MSQELRVPVTLHWSGPPARRVEVLGDFTDFKTGVPLLEHAPGHYRCTLELPTGVHRYKVRLDGRVWVEAPGGAAVDRAEGFGNALLTVNGTLAPLYFAPDRRHVAVMEDGRVILHAEVEGDQAAPADVWIWQEGPNRRIPAPLRLVGRRGAWRMLRAQAQLEDLELTTALYMGFRGMPEHVFRLPLPRSPLGRPPEWVHGAVFYTIFVDRWHRGRASPGLAPDRTVQTSAHTRYGGDLDGITESLDYLRGLGADVLVLTPIHPSPTPHRYDATDLNSVDPALGGEAAFTRLLREAHLRGMRVVADVAVTHVNELHPAFQDLLKRQRESPYLSWFRVLCFPVRARDRTTFEYYYDRPELPWLNLRPGPAREHVLQAVERMVNLGVDGLRLDAMNDAPADFWVELRARARARNPDLALLGEVVSDNPARFAEERAVDLATAFRHREAAKAFFAQGRISASDFWDRVSFDEFRVGPFDPEFRLLFLDNHDTERFMSEAAIYDRLRLALSYLFIRPEPIALTYGTEWAMAGGAPGRALDDAWPERLPMPPLDAPPTQTLALLRHLGDLRRRLASVAPGSLRLVRAEGMLLVVERAGGAETLRAYLNAGLSAVALTDVPVAGRRVLSVNEDDETSPVAPLGPLAARLFMVPRP